MEIIIGPASQGCCENQKGEQGRKPSEKHKQYRGIEASGPTREEQDCNSAGKSYLPCLPCLSLFTIWAAHTSTATAPQPGLGPQFPGFHLAGGSFSRALATRFSSQEGEGLRRYFSIGYLHMLLGVAGWGGTPRYSRDLVLRADHCGEGNSIH